MDYFQVVIALSYTAAIATELPCVTRALAVFRITVAGYCCTKGEHALGVAQYWTAKGHSLLGIGGQISFAIVKQIVADLVSLFRERH